jgi:hypothetical protein
MIVVVVYMPTRSVSEGMWAQEVKLCEGVKAKLKAVGSARQLSAHEARVLEALEEGAAPKQLMLLDLEEELLKLKPEYVVMGGDWNTCPPGCESSRRGDTTAKHRDDSRAIGEFMVNLRLIEPMQEQAAAVRKFALEDACEELNTKLSGPGTQEQKSKMTSKSMKIAAKIKEQTKAENIRTFWTSEADSWLDYFLVSKKLWDRGLVRSVMSVEEGLNEGDHAAIVIDLDMESALGKSALWQDIEAETKKAKESNMNAVFRTIQLKKPERVIAFQEAAVSRWPEGGKLDRRILAYSKEVEAKRARGDESVDWEAVRQLGRQATSRWMKLLGHCWQLRMMYTVLCPRLALIGLTPSM